MKRSICLGTILMLVSLTARADTIEMKVFGMVCGFCAQGIEANLRKNPAITDAGYSLKGVSRTQRTMADYRAAIERSEK